jgi:hypothetical protein
MTPEQTKARIEDVENYLNWNADELCGDDLVGDQKRTKRFKDIMQTIQILKKKHSADLRAVESCKKMLRCPCNQSPALCGSELRDALAERDKAYQAVENDR